MARARSLIALPFWFGDTVPAGRYGAGSVRPVVVPFEQAFDWCWLVKRWRITFDVTQSGSPVWQNGDVEYYASIGGSTALTDEQDTVCRNGVTFVSRSFEQPGGWFQDFSLTLMHSPGSPHLFDYGYGDGSSLLGRVGDNWYPVILFGAEVLEDVANSLRTQPVSPESPLSDVVLILDGIEIPLYESSILGLTGSISIDPIEYWPYARPDGEAPIWNAATGELIGDPHVS